MRPRLFQIDTFEAVNQDPRSHMGLHTNPVRPLTTLQGLRGARGTLPRAPSRPLGLTAPHRDARTRPTRSSPAR